MNKKERFEALSRIGCIVCRLYLGCNTEGHIHHLTGLKFRALGKKASDDHTINLCPTHHLGTSKQFPSVHKNPKLFLEEYGSQESLLEETNKLLAKVP